MEGVRDWFARRQAAGPAARQRAVAVDRKRNWLQQVERCEDESDESGVRV